MKQTTLSMYAQFAYMLGMGLGLLLMPNLLLGLLGQAPATEIWIRVLGALALTFASYYFQLTRQDYQPFYMASVWGRYFFCTVLVLLALSEIGPQVLYLFAGVEAALAIWTHVSVRREQGISA